MLSFNYQALNSPNNENAKQTNSTISTAQQSKSVLQKIINNKNGGPINIFSNLIRQSSHKTLTITKLTNTPQINLNSKPNNLIFTKINSYLLNFSYEDIYTTQSQNNGTSPVNYQLNPNVTITAFAFFPIILNMYSNATVESGAWNTVITQIQTNVYNASIGFDIKFGLQYKFWVDIFGFKPTAGPSSFVVDFPQVWNFPIPFDGQFLGNRLDFTIPTTIPFLSSVGIGVQPKIDADLSSLVQPNNTDISVTKTNLLWQNSNSVQSFSFFTPFSYSSSTAPVSLFNFNMDFTLSLEFSLVINIGIPFLDTFPININIFSLPIATLGLPINGAITNNPTVTPSSAVPYVYGMNYGYNDHNDQIIQPGESVNVTFDVTNIGRGPARNISVTGTSQNVTFYGSDFIPLLNEQQKDYVELTNFYFTVPANYNSNYLYTDALFSYTSPNGTHFNTDFQMYFRVVLPSDTYLQVSQVIFSTPGITTWNAGDSIDLYFNVTNRGSNTITASNISIYNGFDTDAVNPVSITSSSTNTSNTLSIGHSTILGTISLSSPSNHDNGLVYLYFLVYSQDSQYAWYDLYYLVLPVTAPKPSFSLVNSYGFDLTNNNGLFMAGDTVNLQFEVQNIGSGTGYSISADLYSYSPDLNITNSHLTFSNMNPTDVANSTLGQVIISPTAQNQTAIFSITINAYDALGNLFSESFNISIAIVELPPPKIQLIDYLMFDAITGYQISQALPGETVIIFVNITVNNIGIGIIGNITTNDNLDLLNASSYYGALNNQYAYGSGFVFQVPLNYNGSTAYIDVTVSAQSLAGRKVSTSGFISLDIPRGDTTAPVIVTNSLAPTNVAINTQASANVTVTDPLGSLDTISGLYNVYMVYSFNNGSYVVSAMSYNTNSYTYSFDTSKTGTYDYIIVAIDNAGNIAFISNGLNFFTLTVHTVTTTTIYSTSTSTSASTSTSTSTSTSSSSSSTSSNTNNSSENSTNNSSSKTSPGFELTLMVIMIPIFIFLSKSRKKPT